MTLTKLLMASALSTALMFAQGPPGHPGPGGAPPDPQAMIQMRVGFLANSLGLTDDQKTKATTILTDAFTASQSIRASERANRQAIADAVKQNNTAVIDQLSVTAGTLAGQLLAIDSKANAAIYAMLTPDQQAKFDTHPRGGPGGGGPGPAGYRGRSRAPGGQVQQ
ncbi:MAG: Spy/CpxP family protein refolding chaperone [Acidobacteriota bacterium]|nr:Spy/CpxP family protein refolding chaperone [Acidobacteriota bacterium]